MSRNRNAIVAATAVLLATLLPGCATRTTLTPPKGVENYIAGVRAAEAGDRRAAEESLTLALLKNPGLIMPRLVLGDLYYSEHQYAKAIEQYEVATRLDPYDYANFYKLGLSYQVIRRLNEAADAYRRAIELNPQDARSHMNLGLIHLASGNPDAAVRSITRDTELDPRSAPAWANLGVALDAQGSIRPAESAYRRSLELDNTDPTTLLNLGSNLTQQGRSAEAVNALEVVVQKADSALARKRLGDALAAGRKYERAIKEYETALKMEPRYYPAMNAIANALITQYRDGLELDDSKRMRALAQWRKSLAINPSQPRIEGLVKEWDKTTLFRP